jgi:hypothetical protein
VFCGKLKAELNLVDGQFHIVDRCRPVSPLISVSLLELAVGTLQCAEGVSHVDLGCNCSSGDERQRQRQRKNEPTKPGLESHRATPFGSQLPERLLSWRR